LNNKLTIYDNNIFIGVIKYLAGVLKIGQLSTVPVQYDQLNFYTLSYIPDIFVLL